MKKNIVDTSIMNNKNNFFVNPIKFDEIYLHALYIIIEF